MAGFRETTEQFRALRDRRPLRVLVADDDDLLAAYLEQQLVALGCNVALAEDGLAARAMVQDQAFDVLISDWMMPGLDGMGLVRQVRASHERHIHIILMTASDDTAAIQTALEAGVDDFLPKPFSAVSVALSIASARRVLDMQRRLMQRNAELNAARQEAETLWQKARAGLEAAAALQQRLLPAPITSGPVRLQSCFLPSSELGGDVLGASLLDDGQLLFFNLDVAGHGVPAALEAFAMHSRLAFPPPRDPKQLQNVAERLNAEVLSRNGSYATMVLGLMSTCGSRLWMLRAGHPQPILVNNGHARLIAGGGLPLGLVEAAAQPIIEVALAPGDRLLIYSDGVTEADGGDSGIGEAGLLDFMAGMTGVPLDVAMGALEWKVRDASRGRPPADDVSVMAIERAGE